MRWIGVVHDLCSAAVFERLRRARVVACVRCVGESGESAWRAVGGSVTQAGDDGRTLCVGEPAAGAVDHGSVCPPSAAILLRTDGVQCTDPLLWTVLNQLRRMAVELVDGDRRVLRHGTIEVPEVASYADVVGAVADRVGPWLASNPESVPPGAMAPHQHGRLVPGGNWADVDWTRSAAQIAAVVRAFGPPRNGARTRLAGVPVTLHRTAVVTDDRLNVPPGTVVHSGTDGVTVAAGQGLLHIAELADPIGAIDPATVPTGVQFGTDLHGDLLDHARRLADVECVMRHSGSAR